MKKLIENGYGPLLFGIAMAIGVFIGVSLNFNSKVESIFKVNFKNQKVQRLIDFINEDYVDEVDTDSILEVAINNILDNLDPHSTYIPADIHGRIQESMDGSFVGIGVEFRMYRDTVLIVNVLKGGPSEKSNLHNGDRILVADVDTLFGRNIISDSVVSILKGVRDTKVRLSIYRPSSKEFFEKEIVRGKVPIKSVDVAYMINDSLGYMKINRFAGSTYVEFSESLEKLQNIGLKSLVIDLRNNPGGYMHIAKQIADEFLPADKLIVFTKNRKGYVDEEFSSGEGKFKEGNLYVLIDENSASASEVVAGALQDNDRGTIVGRRSFGKGLVQQELDLGDGSAVRLTTARYFTPTGRSIQKPYVGHDNSYDDDYLRRMHSGELLDKDSIKVDDTLKYVTPMGKVVYGGGGIIPDVFVALDTTQYEAWLYSAIRYSYLNEFFLDYVDYNRLELEDMGYEQYRMTFDPDDVVYNRYIKFVSKKGVEISKDEVSKDMLKLRIKAFIARLVWGDEKLYPIWDKIDTMIHIVDSLENTDIN
ncbi:MAG: S41 family peptidase [Flavobacteriales bacterium]|nr:S41 family peptidase [Flavobacteriales bacterium]